MEDLVEMIKSKLNKPKKHYEKHKHFHIYLNGEHHKSFTDSWIRKNHLNSIKFYELSKNKTITLADDRYKKNIDLLHNETEICS